MKYESACAPLERNGDTFYKVFNGEEMKTSKPSPFSNTSIRSDQMFSSKVLHVKLPDIGHTQLLDNRRGSPIASVCVGNEKISDKDVRGFLSDLIRLWLSFSLSNIRSESDIKDGISKLKEDIIDLYPNIKTEWSM